MKILFYIIIVICLTSCFSSKSTIEENVLCKTKELFGRYDTCWIHPGGFMVAPSVLIRTEEGNFACLYGKECDFIKGELLYVRHEYWNTAIKWKPTVVNLSETKKYYLK